MTTLPSMPMFWASFFADTEHVSPDAAKAYLFLIGHAWLRAAQLPADDLALARMARVSPRKWASIKHEVLPFLEGDGEGRLTQKRMRKDWDVICKKREAYREIGSNGGKTSAAKRAMISTNVVKLPVNHIRIRTRTIREDKDATASSATALALAPQQDLLGERKTKVVARHESDESLLDRITDQWNAWATQHGSPSVKMLTGQRAIHCRRRIAELMEVEGSPTEEAAFGRALAYVNESFFVKGAPRKPIGFDQLMREGFLARLIEGEFKYKPNGKGF